MSFEEWADSVRSSNMESIFLFLAVIRTKHRAFQDPAYLWTIFSILSAISSSSLPLILQICPSSISTVTSTFISSAAPSLPPLPSLPPQPQHKAVRVLGIRWAVKSHKLLLLCVWPGNRGGRGREREREREIFCFNTSEPESPLSLAAPSSPYSLRHGQAHAQLQDCISTHYNPNTSPQHTHTHTHTHTLSLTHTHTANFITLTITTTSEHVTAPPPSPPSR